MPSESDLHAYYEHAIDTMAQVYHAATSDGSMPAIAREAVKDVRDTIHTFFFGKGERGGEPGTPGNPLFADIVDARELHQTALGQEAAVGTGQATPERLATPGEIAAEAEPQRAQGTVQGEIYGYDQARGQHAPPGSVYGPEKGVYGPEHGVYGPERGVSGRDHAAPGPLPTPGEIADDRGQDGPLGRGVEVAQVVPPTPGGFVEREIAREKAKQDGNDQGSLERGRVLPDEQMEHDKGRGR